MIASDQLWLSIDLFYKWYFFAQTTNQSLFHLIFQVNSNFGICFPNWDSQMVLKMKKDIMFPIHITYKLFMFPNILLTMCESNLIVGPTYCEWEVTCLIRKWASFICEVKAKLASRRIR